MSAYIRRTLQQLLRKIRCPNSDHTCVYWLGGVNCSRRSHRLFAQSLLSPKKAPAVSWPCTRGLMLGGHLLQGPYPGSLILYGAKLKWCSVNTYKGMERAHPCLKPRSKWMKAVSQPFVFTELDSTALAQVIIKSHVLGASKMVCWLKMPRVGRSQQPNCLTVGGCDSGGHVISRLLKSCDRISIKLQFTVTFNLHCFPWGQW